METTKEFEKIREDYKTRTSILNDVAEFYFKRFSQIENVHVLNYRVKDEEHLIEKIKRKENENPNRHIILENYNKEITDLIGIRILHVFKDGWESIDKNIRENYEKNFIENPIFYFREGDFIEKKDESKFVYKQHKNGYRSIHYIIREVKENFEIPIEVQVRTIFEDAWGEIDHNIVYPNFSDDPIIKDYSGILNRLAGLGDEIGINIRNTKDTLEKYKEKCDILMKELHLSEEQKKILEKQVIIKNSTTSTAGSAILAGGLILLLFLALLADKNQDSEFIKKS